MSIRTTIVAVCLAGVTAVATFAADITGEWKSEFDTQIGPQKYVFTFAEEDGALTAKAKASVGGQPERDVEFRDVKLEGDAISFYETFSFQGMEIRIDYSGTVAGDEMQVTRKVGDFAEEKIVVKRMVEESAAE